MHTLLDIFDLKNRRLGPMESKDFYRSIEEEFRTKGKISRKVQQIRVLMMNSNGCIYAQKRSAFTRQNAGLYDKTIGGHVHFGHTVHVTLVRKCSEELGIPAAILEPKEFNQAIMCTDLKIIGLFKEVGQDKNYQSKRTVKDFECIQPVITTFIVGYYDGPIRFMEHQSSGIELLNPNHLLEDLRSHPERYTDDLRDFLKLYSKHLMPVADIDKPLL
jgi:hypothetical protein